MTKSKGIERLSVCVGLLVSLVVFCRYFWVLFIVESPKGGAVVRSWLSIAIVCFITFFISWVIIHLIYWVYSRFKEDRTSKN